MPEKFKQKKIEDNQFIRKEFWDLLSRGRECAEVLSSQERKRLTEFGYYYLSIYGKECNAADAFKAVQDFEGLRKVADKLFCERPDSYDLPNVLTYLEDHEGIRNLLNRQDIKLPEATYEDAFRSLDDPLHEYIERFLKTNKTPIATGGINKGIDLIAIRNLSKEYDIAVPIARGGLYQGAIADLWGMPTSIADIAAHNRKVPRGKWLNPVALENFKGKDVLLFDKDAITGASVSKAVSMLEQFQPASLAIYFTHPVLSAETTPGIGTITSGLPEGLKIYSPRNALKEKAGDIYIEAHEKLGTLYGRRRQIERKFMEEAEKLQAEFPKLAEAFKKFTTEQCRIFNALNPNVPGISKVREEILLRMEQLFKEHQHQREKKVYSIPGVMENFERILTSTQLLPLGFEDKLINARYSKKAEEAAQRRDVENLHHPDNSLAAFSAARKAVKEGFEVALIVGPEGFAYEPYFNDLGVTTVAVNIPESRENEPRTLKLFDDLSILKGRKVLVVEDDVRTGATLKKLLEHLEPHKPKHLGLYLGQPEKFQKITNIPKNFKNIYLAEETSDVVKEFIEYLELRGLKIFKTSKYQNWETGD